MPTCATPPAWPPPAARRAGAARGRIAIHPDQAIHAAYSPSEAEIAHARRIVEAFATHPEAGTLSIDGMMVDKPHLTQALRTWDAAP